MRDISKETLLAVDERFDSLSHAIEVIGQTSNLITSVTNARFTSRIKPAVCNTACSRAHLDNGICNMTR